MQCQLQDGSSQRPDVVSALRTSVAAQAEMATLWVMATIIIAALITLGGSLAYLIAHERSSNTAQVEETTLTLQRITQKWP